MTSATRIQRATVAKLQGLTPAEIRQLVAALDTETLRTLLAAMDGMADCMAEQHKDNVSSQVWLILVDPVTNEVCNRMGPTTEAIGFASMQLYRKRYEHDLEVQLVMCMESVASTCDQPEGADDDK